MKSDFGEKTLPHINHLYTYALLITGDESKAEKVLMKTYAEAFSFYKYLSEETQITLWLTRIMMNICKNDLSLENTKVKDQNIFQLSVLISLNIEELEQEPSFKITQKLITKIPSLPFELKEVLILIDILKFNYDIAADLIDIPKGTVRKRIFDARKSLLINLLPDGSKFKLDQSSQLNYEEKKFITSYIDVKVQKDQSSERKKIFKQEIDAQIFIKSFLDEHLKLQRVRDTILYRIIKIIAPNQKDEIKKKNIGEKRGLVVVSTIAMFILIAILIIISKPPALSPKEIAAEQFGEDNILIQLTNNHSLFSEGKFTRDMVFGDEEYLSKYLESSGFENKPVFFSYKAWEIESCSTTEFNGKILANYFYKNVDDKYLYVYQVPLSFVEEKNILKLSENLLDFLNSGKCFSNRKGETVYLLKKSGENIFGYAINKQNRDLMVEICKK
ncbi:MAG: RNA polymerase sigma factor [Bacteroidetes bacterium]|nr:RNA polymerase sigma factor [Bacteroidota bacterium]